MSGAERSLRYDPDPATARHVHSYAHFAAWSEATVSLRKSEQPRADTRASKVAMRLVCDDQQPGLVEALYHRVVLSVPNNKYISSLAPLRPIILLPEPLLWVQATLQLQLPAATPDAGHHCLRASKRDRERLQRIREAGAVQCTCDDNFNDMFTPDYILVFPIWECYLVGTLSSEDAVAVQATVTWGDLFGCPEDPNKYLSEFRQAMETLEAMRRQMAGVLSEFMGLQAEGDCNCDTFKALIPPVVHLSAFDDTTNALQAVGAIAPSSMTRAVETIVSMFSAPGTALVTMALARTSLSTLRLNLGDTLLERHPGAALNNAGSLLNALLSGGAASTSRGNPCDSFSLQRSGTTEDLHVTLSSKSTTKQVCSAVAEASSIQSLVLNVGISCDRGESMNHERWGWVAYGWSKASIVSVQEVKLTNIHLSRLCVVSIAAALASNYPLSDFSSKSFTYGYMEIPSGTNFSGLHKCP
ncbi:hypothetical protein ON010_g15165 [Phytophthora cinnamomi]|nr:hypothetical protein ON010_g15165 [Phytophthora cinnamomi]